MMKNNLFKHEHDNKPLDNSPNKPIERVLKAGLNQTSDPSSNLKNGPKNENEPLKKNEPSFKRNASILAAGGYLFQSHLDNATPSNTNAEAPLNTTDNQNFSALDDRPSVSSRAESSMPTQASDPTNNQTPSDSPANPTANIDAAANTTNTTNPVSDLANVQLQNQKISTLAAPLMQHIASIPKTSTASAQKKPMVEITSPKFPTTPTASLTNQNPLLKIIEPTLDHSAAFTREELLAERKRNKEDRERFTQNRLAIQEFDSREAAGETAEMYHELAEDIIDDAYFASLDAPDDWELDEEEVASIRVNNGCKMLKDVENTIVSATISAALLTKNHKAERNEVAGSDWVTNENGAIPQNKTQAQLHPTLASANTAIPNYLDIPAKDTNTDQAEKSVQARV